VKRMPLLTTLFLGGMSLAGAGCSSSGGGGTGTSDAATPPPCGNGKLDPFEQCDDGNTTGGDGCSATCRDEKLGDVTIRWELNTDQKGKDSPAVFRSDACTDFVPSGQGSASMRVRSTSGPTTVDESGNCDTLQLALAKLAIGAYTFELTMRWMDSAAGATMDVTTARTLMVTVPPGATADPPPVVFVNGDFVSRPRGWLFFATRFGSGGAGGCGSVTPAVVRQRLTLTPKAGGGPVTMIKTATGVALDGSSTAEGPCLWPASITDTQRVENLESDLYSFRVEGLDAGGAVIYCKTNTVFVGAGRFNDTYDLVVPSGTSCAP